MKKVSPKAICLEDDLLYSEDVVARHLTCKVKTIQAWRTRGGGVPFLKIGRLVRYRGKDIKYWMEGRLRSSTSEPRGAV